MSVNSKNDIMGIALVSLGQRSPTSPTEQTKASQFANDRYESVRDMVLAAGTWNCASTRASLTLLATAPAFGFSNQFTLPADFLRLIRFQDEDLINIQYRIEAKSNGDGTATRVLLTDEGTANIKYVFRLTEVAKMDELLKNAIAMKLAYQITLALKGSMQQVAFFKREYEETMSEAMFVDALQGPVETMQGTEWLNSRLTGSGEGFRSIENVTS
jgi:hypothetical protein